MDETREIREMEAEIEELKDNLASQPSLAEYLHDITQWWVVSPSSSFFGRIRRWQQPTETHKYFRNLRRAGGGNVMLAVKTARGYRLNGNLVSLRDAITLLQTTGGYLKARAPGVWEVVTSD